MKLKITVETGGERLDQVLSALPEIPSRNAAQKLIENSRVLLNGSAANKKMRVDPNDMIEIDLPEETPSTPIPQAMDLDIIYEDEEIIVVNKPKGMVVHPGAGNPDHTLVNALLFHCGDSLASVGEESRPGIVHRIDKDTSGLLVAAKTDRAYRSLTEQFRGHRVTREYHSVVYGNMKEEQGSIETQIDRHKKNRTKMAVVLQGGKKAITHYEVRKRFAKFSYLSCRLETGRTHQIRVQMAYIGHPVAGDLLYGPKKGITKLNGQCLHSKRLRFSHPVSGEEVCFESELPAYFKEFLHTLGEER